MLPDALIKLEQFSVTCGLFFSLGHSTIVILVVSGRIHLGDAKTYICFLRNL